MNQLGRSRVRKMIKMWISVCRVDLCVVVFIKHIMWAYTMLVTKGNWLETRIRNGWLGYIDIQ